MHNFANDWYAIAFDHLRQEIRDFHIGRIRHLQETETFFTLPPDWNADAYLRRGFFMMRGGRLTMVSLVFDAYQARWIRERHTFHVDEQREDLSNGGLRLSFPVGHNGLDAVARFCLAYAGHCRAEKPAALCRLIRERLQNYCMGTKVMIPLMPQGVEHKDGASFCRQYDSVMIPLMPQGIEHGGFLSLFLLLHE